MKLFKFTSILLCIILLVSVFVGCDTPEESNADVNSKDSLLHNSEDVSETVSEEISEEGSEQLTFVIENRMRETEAFPDAVEEIYRDDEMVYWFPSIMSGVYVVVYSDGTEQGIKEALAEGKVSIADLDRFNIDYMKTPVEQYR